MFTLVMFAVVVVLLALAAIFSRSFGRAQAGFDDILRRGVRAQALVVDLNERYLETVNRESSDMPSYFPVVVFDTPRGSVQAQVLIGARPAPAKKGEQVTVCYDPADPKRVLLDKKGLGSAGSFSCLGTALVAGLVAMAGLVLFFWFVIKIVFHAPI